MSIVHKIDAAVGDRVLAFSPLPPEGRDVDLLVRPAEERVIARLLAEDGFHERGWEWAAFRGGSAEAVDLVPAASLELPVSEIDALFSEALPIDGLGNVVRPTPHHFLLLLARYTAEDGGVLPARRRARIDRALAEDPDAWEAAARRAQSWHARNALPALRLAHEAGASAPLRLRARAKAESLRVLGWPAHRAWPRAWAELTVPRKRQGRLIAFSGLDGAGKSSQAQALKNSLERLGFEDVEIVWNRLEWTTLWENRWLAALSAPVRAALRLVSWASSSRRGTAATAVDEAERAPLEPAHLRERSEAISQVWVSIVSVAHALAQRRLTRAHLRRGTVLISDRYTLDAAVQLRYRYGSQRRFRFQIWLLSRLSPAPLLAYLVDVEAETAHRRQPEEYDVEELTRQAALYRTLAAELGVHIVDGERAREDLCAEVAAEAWRALHESR